jgi:uncharacterized protein YbcI
MIGNGGQVRADSFPREQGGMTYVLTNRSAAPRLTSEVLDLEERTCEAVDALRMRRVQTVKRVISCQHNSMPKIMGHTGFGICVNIYTKNGEFPMVVSLAKLRRHQKREAGIFCGLDLNNCRHLRNPVRNAHTR